MPISAVITVFLISCVTGLDSAENLGILFVNDIQYNIFPVAENGSGVCNSADAGCLGGLTRLLKLRESKKKNETIPLLLSAGGSLDGEWYNILKCQPLSMALKQASFDAVALDAEMFKYGTQLATACMKDLDGILVSANYPNSKWTTTVVKRGKENSISIGIIGITDKEKLQGFGINGTDAKSSVDEAVKKLTNMNLTIVIGTLTVEVAEEIAKIAGINLVLFNGEIADQSTIKDGLFLKKINNTYIASMNITHGTTPDFRAGYIEFPIGEEKLTNLASSELVSSSENYGILLPKDNAYLSEITTSLMTPVTTLSVDITNTGCDHEECLIGNLFADAMVYALQNDEKSTKWGEMVKVGMIPMNDLMKFNLTKGSLTLQDVYEYYNPDVLIQTVSLTGKDLKTLFDTSVKDYGSAKPINFLQVSSLISVEYNFKRKIVNRVRTVEGSFKNSTKLQDVKLDDETTKYKIVFPSTLLNLENYKYIENISDHNKTDFFMGKALEDYFKAIKYLTLFPVGQRITEASTNKSPNTPSCPNHTAEAVFITLSMITLMVVGTFVTWKYLIPRIRERRGSTLPLASNRIS